MRPSDPGYWKPPAPPVGWPERDPMPEVCSTDPRPADAPGDPSAVVKLLTALRAGGWTAEVAYSRGPERAVRVGTYKMTEHFGVWAAAGHPSGYRVMARYSRTVGREWAWDIRIWLPGERKPRFRHALISDLHEFIGVRGSVNLAWFKGIHAREEDKAAKAKAAARNRVTKKEGAS